MTSLVLEQLIQLRPEPLEELCGQLLSNRGWTIEGESRPDLGAEFVARDPENRRYVVGVKSGRYSLQAAAMYRLAAQQKLHSAERSLLMTTQSVSKRLAEEMRALEIELWDGDALARIVESDPVLHAELILRDEAPRPLRPGELRLRRLRIQGYRGIVELEIQLPQRGPAVLAGINGAGKSTVLAAIATGLQWLLVRLARPDGRGRPIPDHDINNHGNYCAIELSTSIDGLYAEWSVAAARKGLSLKPRSELESLNQALRSIQLDLEQNPDRPLPVVAMYTVNRAVLDIPKRIKKRHEFDRFSAYDGALVLAGKAEFRAFFEWFRDREDLENENRLRRPEYRDPQLVAVRTAIETLLENVSSLRVRRNPQRMVVDKDGEELIVDQLSDGEKCLLATVGDLARRLALANPSSTDPLNEHGVVLIDEIDLHLHPRWQRRVIPDLERTFPNCQFIVTTHSPQVLSHVKAETIRLGRGAQGLTVLDRRSVYGWDTNRILEEFLEVDERPPEVKEGLDDYFRKIQSGRLDEAEQARRQLEAEIGADEPSFKKADVLMRHRKLLAGE